MDLEKTLEHRVVKTGIVCTIGPVTMSVDMLCKLMQAGMNVCRLNFSHGTHDFHQKLIDNVREASKKTNISIALMLDTKGPEIRTCYLEDDPATKEPKKVILLKKGNKFVFKTDPAFKGNESGVAVTYDKLPSTVKVGGIILVDDGLISFKVDKVTDTEVHTTIMNSGEIGNQKGVNLPGVAVELPAVTEKDKKDIAFGVKNNVDMIAASFIRTGANVEEIRNLPGVRDASIHIVSKIESQEGLDNYDEILKASDGIMVARGDLGVEIPIERVANAQKMMIRECNLVGKPVITATQMLDSMIEFPRPTRAEATDVANAVFDGTDCVMLSGETAKGKYPVETVTMMRKICKEAEQVIQYRNLYMSLRKQVIYKTSGDISISESIASSAVKTSWDLQASLIIVLSDSGSTCRYVSKYRPHCPVLCITSTAKTAAQVLLSRSAQPFLVPSMQDTEAILKAGVEFAKKQGVVKAGEKMVVTSGVISGLSGGTNMMRVISCE